MRLVFLVFGLLVLPSALLAVDLRPVISREALKYAAAWERSNHEAIVGYLPPPMLRRAGGRAGFVLELKDQFAQARELGVTELESNVGPPTVPKQIGRWLASVLPVTAVLHSAHLRLTQKTQVLALSADKGKKWSFLLLYEISQQDLNTFFPEFQGKVFVPTPPAPELKIVY